MSQICNEAIFAHGDVGSERSFSFPGWWCLQCFFAASLSLTWPLSTSFYLFSLLLYYVCLACVEYNEYICMKNNTTLKNNTIYQYKSKCICRLIISHLAYQYLISSFLSTTILCLPCLHRVQRIDMYEKQHNTQKQHDTSIQIKAYMQTYYLSLVFLVPDFISSPFYNTMSRVQ